MLEAGELQARDGASWENDEALPSVLSCTQAHPKFLNGLLKDKLPHSQNACQHSMPYLLQQIMNDRANQFLSGKNHTSLGYFLVARNRNPFELA